MASTARITPRARPTALYGLNAKWDVGKAGKIEADVAYQDSKYKTAFMALRTDRTAGGSMSISTRAAAFLLQLHRPEPAHQSGGVESGAAL
jgi:hypothetical protein